ncbi:MAG: bifunctional sugar-1-phosphate nucleotidylyltransferase/acetyltransferase [Patescibacteria group bacterium]
MTKVVILAAGWGTRMRPLTHTKPKPALRVAGKTLIEHNLDQLTGLVEEAVLVIGYKGEIIKKELGDEYRGIKIKYAKQEEPIGTGDAAKSALPFLDDDFLILNGDDLYKRSDLEECLRENPCIMVKEVDNPSGFGQMVCKDGEIKDLVEKPEENVSNLVNIGAYYVNKDFFEVDIEKSSRGEYEITDYIKNYIESNCVNYHVAESWDPVSYPWNLLESTKHIFEDYEEKNEGNLEKNVVLEGKVIIEKGAKIKTGTKIEGPVYIGKNCEIGPNCYIRPFSSIDDGCKVGQSVEIKNTILGRNSNAPHLTYLGDSVLGEDCNLGAGTIAANFKFDESIIRTEVKGKVMSTRRKKLGAILGDGVKTGINVSLMPGVMIGANSTIYPHKIVNKNIKKEKIYK